MLLFFFLKKPGRYIFSCGSEAGHISVMPTKRTVITYIKNCRMFCSLFKAGVYYLLQLALEVLFVSRRKNMVSSGSG
jgi:hypothetical protein